MGEKKPTLPVSRTESAKVSRRRFVGGGAVAAAAASIPLQPLLGGKESQAEAAVVPYNSHTRAAASMTYRMSMARNEHINVGIQPDNGDSQRFTDFSGNYSKALLHDALGVPNKASYQSMLNALRSGQFADFENMIMGTLGGGPNSKENGPQGGLALDLEGFDSHAVVIPPAPSVASAQTAAEAVEHYWGALLRDVPFIEYSSNSRVAQAAADMNKLSFLQSAANNLVPFPVTPQNLFRGQFVPSDGNAQGPYISQFMVQPTFLGVQPLSQQYQTFLPGVSNEFITSVSEFQLIQNGGSSGKNVAFDASFRYVRDGRDLSAYTHVDVLYQAYLIATLVLSSINAPPNPGNPYIGSRTEKPSALSGDRTRWERSPPWRPAL